MLLPQGGDPPEPQDGPATSEFGKRLHHKGARPSHCSSTICALLLEQFNPSAGLQQASGVSGTRRGPPGRDHTSCSVDRAAGELVVFCYSGPAVQRCGASWQGSRAARATPANESAAPKRPGMPEFCDLSDMDPSTSRMSALPPTSSRPLPPARLAAPPLPPWPSR